METFLKEMYNDMMQDGLWQGNALMTLCRLLPPFPPLPFPAGTSAGGGGGGVSRCMCVDVSVCVCVGVCVCAKYSSYHILLLF